MKAADKISDTAYVQDFTFGRKPQRRERKMKYIYLVVNLSVTIELGLYFRLLYSEKLNDQ